MYWMTAGKLLPSSAVDGSRSTSSGRTAKDSVGVIIEAKKPGNKAEMLSPERPNSKALHELLRYYLNERSRAIFRRLVETYLASGDPVGSRTLTRDMSEKVSAATIRNVMQDLEYLGLLDSPHISAGRIPTQEGLRMFVDGLLEVGDLENTDRQMIDATLGSNSDDVAAALDRLD